MAPGASLSDVRADLHFISVLVFRRECLVVTAAASDAARSQIDLISRETASVASSRRGHREMIGVP